MASINIKIVSDTSGAIQSVQALGVDIGALDDKLRSMGTEGTAQAFNLQQAMQRAAQGISGPTSLSDEIQKSTTFLKESGISAQEFGEIAPGGFKNVSDSAKTLSGDLDGITRSAGDVSTSAQKVSDDLEDVGNKGTTGSKLAESAMMNLGYSSMGASQLMDGPGGIIESLGQFLAFGGQSLDVVPGVGLALGALATVGGLALTVLGGKMGDTTGNANALNAAVGQIASAMNTAGDTSTGMADQVKANLDAMLQGTYKTADGTSVSYGQMKTQAGELGVSVTDLQQAYAGVPSAINKVNDAIDTSRSKYSELANTADGNIGKLHDADQLKGAIDDVNTALTGNSKATNAAATAYNDYNKDLAGTAGMSAVTTAATNLKTAFSDASTEAQNLGTSIDSTTARSKDDTKKAADAAIANSQQAMEDSKTFATLMSGNFTAAQETIIQNNSTTAVEIAQAYGPNSKQMRDWLSNMQASASTVSNAAKEKLEEIAQQKYTATIMASVIADPNNAANLSRIRNSLQSNIPGLVIPVSAGRAISQ